MKFKTRSESIFAFTDKTTGDTVKFAPVPGKYVLSYNEAEAIETEAAGTADSVFESAEIDPTFDAVRGYRIVELDVLSDDNLEIEALTAHLPEEDTEPAVNSLPVMRDEDGNERFVVPDEFAVQFNDDVSEVESEEMLGELGLRIKTRYQTHGFYMVEVPEGKGLFETMEALVRSPSVAFVEPSEFTVDDQLASEDVLSSNELGLLWGLENTGQTIKGTTGTPGMDVRARQAWSISRGGPSVVIAVLDTGCQMDHPDLASNILPRPVGEVWNFVNPSAGDTSDPKGHGTHVCGTCAASANGVGVVGLAPDCKLMPLQVKLRAGAADYQRRTDAINLVTRKATSNSTRYVLNLSWRTSGDVISIRRAIAASIDAGVIVVAAVGNGNSNMDLKKHYPVSYPGIIAVAALNQKGIRASFSNYGDRVDITAPGVNIRSCIPGSRYGHKNGTSMAAPHVTAAAALLLTLQPTATVDQVRTWLTSSARPVVSLNQALVGKLGAGMLDAAKALSNIVTS